MEASTETDRGSLSWWQRAAIGLILGGVFGVLEFLPAFSVFGFASAAAAGAIGYSTLAVVGPAFHRWPIVECVVCALIGACAGLVWATVGSSSVVPATIYAAILGIVAWFAEIREVEQQT